MMISYNRLDAIAKGCWSAPWSLRPISKECFLSESNKISIEIIEALSVIIRQEEFECNRRTNRLKLLAHF